MKNEYGEKLITFKYRKWEKNLKFRGYLPGLLSGLEPSAADAKPTRPEGPGNPPNPVGEKRENRLVNKE